MTAITKDNSTHASDNATPCPRCGSTIRGYKHQQALGVWQTICWGCGHRSHFRGPLKLDENSGAAEIRRAEAAEAGDFALAQE